MRDITKIWIKSKGTKGTVSILQEYVINGEKYIVDGKHIIVNFSQQERRIAFILSDDYGKNVEIVPQVLYPQGIKTPDYLIDGERYDLKSPTGSGKNLLYGLIAKKKEQSHNFIIDTTNCPLSMETLIGQAEILYGSWRVGFLEKLVFIKNSRIEKVLSRE